MAKSQPIKRKEDIAQMKNYFEGRGEWRNYALFVLGINTALRISDLLILKWDDVYDFRQRSFRRHLKVIEKKTKKKNIIALNKSVIEALEKYLEHDADTFEPGNYIFSRRSSINEPIKRNRAYTIIRQAAVKNNIEGVICCHSLRKTFGYHAWRAGIPSAIIMDIFNHSSLEITKRYLSIDQDERDEIFEKLLL